MPSLMQMLEGARTPTQGPETELCEAALQHRLPTDKRLDRLVFREPKMPTGFPDVVAVYPRRTTFDYEEPRRDLNLDHLRVLHYLYHCRGQAIEALAANLGRTVRKTLRIVNELEDANLLLRRGNHVSPRSLTRVFVAKRIVAIEFKIANWKKAIRQAAANTWFASHSYVLIRPHRHIEQIKVAAGQVGVGVLVYDGEQVYAELEATGRDIPASYGSWVINEWTLQRVHEGNGDDRPL